MHVAGPGPGKIDEQFRIRLDESVWTAAYLPAWSSRAAAAAAVRVEADGLHLSIPREHPVWCAGLHEPPLRVSAVQSANWSGPLGSSRGQQPFRDGLRVREFQPEQWGYTPHYGRLEVTCRADIGPGSMFSAWLIGLEDEPERCGEICLVEVFGDSVANGTVGLGCGIHKFRDPALTEEFAIHPHEIDVGEDHRYALDWQPGRVSFFLDGAPIVTLDQAPDYPMELIIAVFDFPDAAGSTDVMPELVVSRVLGTSD